VSEGFVDWCAYARLLDLCACLARDSLEILYLPYIFSGSDFQYGK
jgi:hypothetical protein